MVKLTVEPISTPLLNEAIPLTQDHWEEVALYKDEIKLTPDYGSYFKAQKKNQLLVITARDEGKLVGYCVFFLTEGLHYQGTFTGVNDIIYISKAYRGGTVAYRMLKLAEKELIAMGAAVMRMDMKAHAPFERLCEALDMQPHEISYSKYLAT